MSMFHDRVRIRVTKHRIHALVHIANILLRKHAARHARLVGEHDDRETKLASSSNRGCGGVDQDDFRRVPEIPICRDERVIAVEK
jgi:hypothetical protein